MAGKSDRRRAYVPVVMVAAMIAVGSVGGIAAATQGGNPPDRSCEGTPVDNPGRGLGHLGLSAPGNGRKAGHDGHGDCQGFEPAAVAVTVPVTTVPVVTVPVVTVPVVTVPVTTVPVVTVPVTTVPVTVPQPPKGPLAGPASGSTRSK